MITHISNAAAVGGVCIMGINFLLQPKPFNTIPWFLHNIDTTECPGCQYRAGPGPEVVEGS